MDQPTFVPTEALPFEGWDDPARGSITWKTVFSGERTPTSGLTVGIAELPADGTVSNARHRHAHAEVYYILSGDGVVEVEGRAETVSAGTAVFIPGGAEHSVRNSGTTVLRLLYTFAADRFTDVQYEFTEPSP